MSSRYAASDLIAFAAQLFAAAGCDGDKPDTIARLLVEADLLGHTTHGLALAPGYLADLHTGGMTATGAPVIVQDRGAAVTWDGNRLPGVWLAAKAVDLAVERAPTYGTATLVIRKSHHIACLAALLQRATDRGFMVQVASSDPAFKSVAPFGGTQPVYTPNPLAVGIPTEGDPVLIDVSASITTNGMANRLRKEGKRFPGAWARDAQGVPTDDPEALFTNPPGSLLPVGGADHGHKGFGFGLMIEALTQALGGYGRAEAPTQWGASVFVQVIDPTAFGGAADFRRETEWLVRACRASAPAPGCSAVRLPGERGLARKRRALAEGVELYAGVLAALEPHAARLGVPVPNAVS